MQADSIAVTGGSRPRARDQQHTKKLTLMKEINQLDLKLQSLMKEKQVRLYRKTPGLFSDLEESEKRLHTDYRAERLKTRRELHRIKTMVQKFHDELKNVKPTPEFLERLKVVMEEIEQNIMTFKDHQRDIYENLMVSEIQHTQEIAALEKKFETWSRVSEAPVERKPVTNLPSARDVIKDLPPEVAAFEKFLLQTGGIRGGWDEYDHGTFLRWRVRHKGRATFIEAAISHLPTKTAGQVRDHENWYQDFLSLQEQKKIAIDEWKKAKEEEKRNQAAQLGDDSEDENPLQSEHYQKLVEKERQERKAKLNSWKIQKEIKRAEKEEKDLLEAKAIQQQEQELHKRQQELRQKVAEYRQQKEEEEEFLAMEAEAKQWEEQEAIKERLLENKQRIETRNEYAIMSKVKQKKMLDEKKMAQKKREERLRAQYEPGVQRDPGRLLKPTAGWRERTKQVGASSESGRVYHSVSHRAVPSWRQGL